MKIAKLKAIKPSFILTFLFWLFFIGVTTAQGQSCGFTGQWHTGNPFWENMICSQSGSSVHCDYTLMEGKYPGSLDGTLAEDGETVIGEWSNHTNGALAVDNGGVKLVRNTPNGFWGEWWHDDPNTIKGRFGGDRVGEPCVVSVDPTPNPPPDEPQSYPDQTGDYYEDDTDYYDDDSDYYSDSDFSYDDSNGLLEILAVGGGIIVIGGGTLGGGYLGYRAIRNRLARRAIKKIKQVPVKSPAPAPAPAPPKPLPRQMPEKMLKRKIDNLSDDIDRLLEKLKQHNPARDEVEFYKRQAKIFEHKIDVIDKFDTGTRIIKKVNDLAVDTVGHFPGIGQKFRWGYYGVTEGIMKTIETGSLLKGFSQGFKSAGEKYMGDKFSDKLIKFKSIQPNAPIKAIKEQSSFFGRIGRSILRKGFEKPAEMAKKLLKLIWR